MRTVALRSIIGVVCSGLVACSPSHSGSQPTDEVDRGSPPDANSPLTDEERDACEELARAECRHRAACDSDRGPDSVSPDEECLFIEAVRCERIYALSSVGRGPQGPLSVARALDERACGQVPTRPESWRGTLKVGEACIRAEQCADGFCVNEGACSYCRKLLSDAAALDGPCSKDQEGVRICGVGLMCRVDAADVSHGTCVEQPVEGSSCDAAATYVACLSGELECVDGRCRAASFLNEPCDPAEDKCSSYYGLNCDEATRRCQYFASRERVGLGDKCGGINSVGFCDRGLYCALPEGANPGYYDGPGTCTPISGLHGPCQDGRLSCVTGLSCVDRSCEIVLAFGASEDGAACR